MIRSLCGPQHANRGEYSPTMRAPVLQCVVAGMVVVFMIAADSCAKAAGQQDYDDCSLTNDIARGMAACTRIIADQSQSATDRAGAYVQRGNDYVASGRLDDAIVNFSSAINLEPGNTLAYTARAIVHWRKQERNHAAVDYGIAAFLDADRMAELAKANTEIKAIADVAWPPAPRSNSTSSAAWEGEFCPTADSARDGYEMFDRERDLHHVVQPFYGNLIRSQTFRAGKLIVAELSYKGRFAIAQQDVGGIASFHHFDFDYTKTPELDLNTGRTYHVMTLTSDGKASLSTADRDVAAREKVSIGKCALDTFGIVARDTLPDGHVSDFFGNFSPVLRDTVRILGMTQGSSILVQYDSIEALKKQ